METLLCSFLSLSILLLLLCALPSSLFPASYSLLSPSAAPSPLTSLPCAPGLLGCASPFSLYSSSSLTYFFPLAPPPPPFSSNICHQPPLLSSFKRNLSSPLILRSTIQPEASSAGCPPSDLTSSPAPPRWLNPTPTYKTKTVALFEVGVRTLILTV